MSRVNLELIEMSRIPFILYVLYTIDLLYTLDPTLTWTLQIGFLTEWQMYAQKIEGDSWLGEKIDSGKIDKMSGKRCFLVG